VVDVDSLANIFGCRVAWLLMKYLGLPLRASCGGLENGPTLHHVVSMVRTEWEIFRGFRKKLRGSFTFLSRYSLHLGGSLACPFCDYLL
jgi:hypothetical protein